ncbi:hypothetical protein QC823_05100 [Halomonas vilamensis]|uniref:Thioredoxin domain-containing protein n=1 Tax=Vreelandella vilamensis TaxID=531309 RepID=A0ABU1H3N6_9GAMM|nr:hypothetical protein [Halomonas vilamensis]MDR5898367.1 hypothetical protein [Halomonas vilamensis]
MINLTYQKRQRLKLIMIILIFTAPMLVAWGMVVWRLGIPEESMANGNVNVTLPELAQWPIDDNKPLKSGTWVLVFDCAQKCSQRSDELWRLHRALGRDAERLTRLRIGGEDPALPGEIVTRWSLKPEWARPNNAWLLDPMGQTAVAFGPHLSTQKLLDDIQHALKVNPY